jgi:DNA polymerase III subunit alpha
MSKSFSHLHVHTEYSMLDGAARIKDAVAAAVRDGQPGIGITDHGNMYGVLDMYRECRAQGITPVLGEEIYMAKETCEERPARKSKKVDDTGGDSDGGDKLYYHLTLLAETTEGYRNLMKLSSSAFLEGFYYKPRADWEMLERYSGGLIATTGCLGGLVLQDILKGNYRGAVEKAARLQDIFGRDNLFVEIQDHGIPEQQQTNPHLLRLAEEIGAPLLLTNDSHYVDAHGAEPHDALLCIQTGAQLTDKNRFKFASDQHWLKSAAEMRSLFPDHPEASDNTLWIVERANVEIEFGKYALPQFSVPKGFADDATYLTYLVNRGAKKRWGVVTSEVQERIDFELKTIISMGFASYFLIVWDLMRHAREAGVRAGPGRGSAAGCAVSYCLGITHLDPIEYDLLFERFLNPSRISMPDIDMDFDDRGRDEMIRYAVEKYGRDHVAQIITFNSIKARAGVRDAARVSGAGYGLGDQIVKAMPPVLMGRSTPIDACLHKTKGYESGYDAAAGFRELYETNPDARKVIDLAKGLEELKRSDGIHAAAVVITPDPLTEYIPIQRKPSGKKPIEECPIVTQYEMHGVEDLGLLKMDFLGLTTLTVIEDTLAFIRDTTGETIDISRIPLDDLQTFEMLQAGDSTGVFQLEGGPMRALMVALAPESIHDLGALVALYRPGPMARNMHYDYADRKNGRKPVEYDHPEMEEILGETYGLMIYQELMMRVAQKFAGYSLAEADNLRKAAGKKIREIMAKERDKFVQGCVKSGYTEDLGTLIFDIIEPFADYAFNKSHAYAYALIAYQTAWLKAHYPVHFFAALLSSVSDKQEKLSVYLHACRQAGITVIPPDVNLSVSDFRVVEVDGEPVISFGLEGVRNVGAGAVKYILSERNKNGPYESFYDYCDRVPLTALKKNVVEALIQAGAFSNMGLPRKGLAKVANDILDRAVAKRKKSDKGMVSLFDGMGIEEDFDTIEIPSEESVRSELLKREKQVLGQYVSGHPLDSITAVLQRSADVGIPEFKEMETETQKTLAGMLSKVELKTTRKGDRMAICTLEDAAGEIELVVFPRTYANVASVLTVDAIVKVRAKLEVTEEKTKAFAQTIEVIDVANVDDSILTVDLGSREFTSEFLRDLKRCFTDNPGDTIVWLQTNSGVVKLPNVYAVNVTMELMTALDDLLT